MEFAPATLISEIVEQVSGDILLHMVHTKVNHNYAGGLSIRHSDMLECMIVVLCATTFARRMESRLCAWC